MKVELTAIEARVIGCLIEKEVTTPDQYPLSLNALTNACNQKSNREPVMSLSEADVLDAVDALIERRLVSDESGFNSRVSKYQHRFCNTEFGDLKLTEQEKEEINKKRVSKKYYAQDSKHYNWDYLKEKKEMESEQYEFTHTRKGVEHKIKLYRLN